MNQELLKFQNDFSHMVIDKSTSSDRKQALRNSINNSQRDQFEKRFAVYRNNVHHSLIQALADTFPVTNQLVGEEFFAMMAKEYLQSFPPKSAVLLEFGNGFSDFVRSFKPAESLNYLSDVLMLEYAWQESYHSEDITSVGADYFAEVPAEELYRQSLACHPGLRLVKSDFAIGSIWQLHHHDMEEAENPFSELNTGSQFSVDSQFNVDSPEWLAVVRPEYDVQICFLDEPAFQFISKLEQGTSLGESISELAELFPDWDIGQSLAFAIQNGFFVGRKS